MLQLLPSVGHARSKPASRFCFRALAHKLQATAGLGIELYNVPDASQPLSVLLDSSVSLKQLQAQARCSSCNQASQNTTPDDAVRTNSVASCNSARVTNFIRLNSTAALLRTPPASNGFLLRGPQLGKVDYTTTYVVSTARPAESHRCSLFTSSSGEAAGWLHQLVSQLGWPDPHLSPASSRYANNAFSAASKLHTQHVSRLLITSKQPAVAQRARDNKVCQEQAGYILQQALHTGSEFLPKAGHITSLQPLCQLPNLMNSGVMAQILHNHSDSVLVSKAIAASRWTLAQVAADDSHAHAVMQLLQMHALQLLQIMPGLPLSYNSNLMSIKGSDYLLALLARRCLEHCWHSLSGTNTAKASQAWYRAACCILHAGADLPWARALAAFALSKSILHLPSVARSGTAPATAVMSSEASGATGTAAEHEDPRASMPSKKGPTLAMHAVHNSDDGASSPHTKVVSGTDSQQPQHDTATLQNAAALLEHVASCPFPCGVPSLLHSQDYPVVKMQVFCALAAAARHGFVGTMAALHAEKPSGDPAASPSANNSGSVAKQTISSRCALQTEREYTLQGLQAMRDLLSGPAWQDMFQSVLLSQKLLTQMVFLVGAAVQLGTLHLKTDSTSPTKASDSSLESMLLLAKRPEFWSQTRQMQDSNLHDAVRQAMRLALVVKEVQGDLEMDELQSLQPYLTAIKQANVADASMVHGPDNNTYTTNLVWLISDRVMKPENWTDRASMEAALRKASQHIHPKALLHQARLLATCSSNTAQEASRQLFLRYLRVMLTYYPPTACMSDFRALAALTLQAHGNHVSALSLWFGLREPHALDRRDLIAALQRPMWRLVKTFKLEELISGRTHPVGPDPLLQRVTGNLVTHLAVTHLPAIMSQHPQRQPSPWTQMHWYDSANAGMGTAKQGVDPSRQDHASTGWGHYTQGSKTQGLHTAAGGGASGTHRCEASGQWVEPNAGPPATDSLPSDSSDIHHNPAETGKLNADLCLSSLPSASSDSFARGARVDVAISTTDCSSQAAKNVQPTDSEALSSQSSLVQSSLTPDRVHLGDARPDATVSHTELDLSTEVSSQSEVNSVETAQTAGSSMPAMSGGGVAESAHSPAAQQPAHPTTQQPSTVASHADQAAGSQARSGLAAHVAAAADPAPSNVQTNSWRLFNPPSQLAASDHILVGSAISVEHEGQSVRDAAAQPAAEAIKSQAQNSTADVVAVSARADACTASEALSTVHASTQDVAMAEGKQAQAAALGSTQPERSNAHGGRHPGHRDFESEHVRPNYTPGKDTASQIQDGSVEVQHGNSDTWIPLQELLHILVADSADVSLSYLPPALQTDLQLLALKEDLALLLKRDKQQSWLQQFRQMLPLRWFNPMSSSCRRRSTQQREVESPNTADAADYLRPQLEGGFLDQLQRKGCHSPHSWHSFLGPATAMACNMADKHFPARGHMQNAWQDANTVVLQPLAYYLRTTGHGANPCVLAMWATQLLQRGDTGAVFLALPRIMAQLTNAQQQLLLELVPWPVHAADAVQGPDAEPSEAAGAANAAAAVSKPDALPAAAVKESLAAGKHTMPTHQKAVDSNPDGSPSLMQLGQPGASKPLAASQHKRPVIAFKGSQHANPEPGPAFIVVEQGTNVRVMDLDELLKLPQQAHQPELQGSWHAPPQEVNASVSTWINLQQQLRMYPRRYLQHLLQPLQSPSVALKLSQQPVTTAVQAMLQHYSQPDVPGPLPPHHLSVPHLFALADCIIGANQPDHHTTVQQGQAASQSSSSPDKHAAVSTVEAASGVPTMPYSASSSSSGAFASQHDGTFGAADGNQSLSIPAIDAGQVHSSSSQMQVLAGKVIKRLLDLYTQEASPHMSSDNVLAYTTRTTANSGACDLRPVSQSHVPHLDMQGSDATPMQAEAAAVQTNQKAGNSMHKLLKAAEVLKVTQVPESAVFSLFATVMQSKEPHIQPAVAAVAAALQYHPAGTAWWEPVFVHLVKPLVSRIRGTGESHSVAAQGIQSATAAASEAELANAELMQQLQLWLQHGLFLPPALLASAADAILHSPLPNLSAAQSATRLFLLPEARNLLVSAATMPQHAASTAELEQELHISDAATLHSLRQSTIQALEVLLRHGDLQTASCLLQHISPQVPSLADGVSSTATSNIKAGTVPASAATVAGTTAPISTHFMHPVIKAAVASGHVSWIAAELTQLLHHQGYIADGLTFLQLLPHVQEFKTAGGSFLSSSTVTPASIASPTRSAMYAGSNCTDGLLRLESLPSYHFEAFRRAETDLHHGPYKMGAQATSTAADHTAAMKTITHNAEDAAMHDATSSPAAGSPSAAGAGAAQLQNAAAVQQLVNYVLQCRITSSLSDLLMASLQLNQAGVARKVLSIASQPPVVRLPPECYKAALQYARLHTEVDLAVTSVESAASAGYKQELMYQPSLQAIAGLCCSAADVTPCPSTTNSTSLHSHGIMETSVEPPIGHIRSQIHPNQHLPAAASVVPKGMLLLDAFLPLCSPGNVSEFMQFLCSDHSPAHTAAVQHTATFASTKKMQLTPAGLGSLSSWCLQLCLPAHLDDMECNMTVIKLLQQHLLHDPDIVKAMAASQQRDMALSLAQAGDLDGAMTVLQQLSQSAAHLAFGGYIRLKSDIANIIRLAVDGTHDPHTVVHEAHAQLHDNKALSTHATVVGQLPSSFHKSLLAAFEPASMGSTSLQRTLDQSFSIVLAACRHPQTSSEAHLELCHLLEKNPHIQDRAGFQKHLFSLISTGDIPRVHELLVRASLEPADYLAVLKHTLQQFSDTAAAAKEQAVKGKAATIATPISHASVSVFSVLLPTDAARLIELCIAKQGHHAPLYASTIVQLLASGSVGDAVALEVWNGIGAGCSAADASLSIAVAAEVLQHQGTYPASSSAMRILDQAVHFSSRPEAVGEKWPVGLGRAVQWELKALTTLLSRLCRPDYRGDGSMTGAGTKSAAAGPNMHSPLQSLSRTGWTASERPHGSAWSVKHPASDIHPGPDEPSLLATDDRSDLAWQLYMALASHHPVQVLVHKLGVEDIRVLLDLAVKRDSLDLGLQLMKEAGSNTWSCEHLANITTWEQLSQACSYIQLRTHALAALAATAPRQAAHDATQQLLACLCSLTDSKLFHFSITPSLASPPRGQADHAALSTVTSTSMPMQRPIAMHHAGFLRATQMVDLVDAFETVSTLLISSSDAQDAAQQLHEGVRQLLDCCAHEGTIQELARLQEQLIHVYLKLSSIIAQLKQLLGDEHVQHLESKADNLLAQVETEAASEQSAAV